MGPAPPAKLQRPFLGPELTEAVQRTRLVACLLAIALATALHAGWLQVAQLPAPPVVVLLLTQVGGWVGGWVGAWMAAGGGIT